MGSPAVFCSLEWAPPRGYIYKSSCCLQVLFFICIEIKKEPVIYLSILYEFHFISVHKDTSTSHYSTQLLFPFDSLLLNLHHSFLSSMASQYSLLDYDSDEDREQNPEIPVSHLASAAFFIADLLDRHGITYALMGGFAVKLMGGTRNTRDVDIAFQAPGKMRDLCRVVEVEPRYALWPRLVSDN